ncbi:Ribonuclease 3 [Bacteroidales bacterium Barb6XT]|nr:Ribonuclease 3 [Bacteroidales bacterium Barb6XT]
MIGKIKDKIRLLRHKGKESYLSVYKITGVCPKDIRFYELALLHKSSCVEAPGGRRIDNERMEFLGDAVLSSIVADILYKRYPGEQEGFLTDARSKIVQRKTLNHIAEVLGLPKMIRCKAIRFTYKNYLPGNALEALVAAVYLDLGYRSCYRFIEDIILGKHVPLETLVRKEINFKSSFLEWCQKNKVKVHFALADTFFSPRGTTLFRTDICIGFRYITIGTGTGASKKESQQNAAKNVLKQLRTDKDFLQYILASNSEPEPEIEQDNVPAPESLEPLY